MRIVSNLRELPPQPAEPQSRSCRWTTCRPTEPSVQRDGLRHQRLDGPERDPLHRLESEDGGKRIREALTTPGKAALAIIMFTIEEMPQKQVPRRWGAASRR